MADVRVEHPASDPASGEGLAHVALVTIDRPHVLNALDSATMAALVDRLRRLEGDDGCRAIVLAGADERAFAAGADIREMSRLTPDEVRASGTFERWDEVAELATPLVAAVRGYALGGGCELALACDLIVAAEDAVFGLPEVSLGIIPGVGGTQRLPRAVGQAVAMEMILAGRRLSGAEAVAAGLAARAVPAAEVVPEPHRIAAAIAANAPGAVRQAKRAVRAAAEVPLPDGVAAERRAFAALFGTEDQREGMAAFLERRRPTWTGREARAPRSVSRSSAPA
jgi:enoyl-CoA hydratase